MNTNTPASIPRRDFLGSAAAFARRAAGAAGGSQRIDCQSHLFCPELVALMEKRTEDPRVFVKDGVRVLQMGVWLRKILPHYTDVDAKLRTMDASGIAMTAL